MTYLVGLAAVTGLIHTILGPDHYVPFIAMARARRWNLARTLSVAAVCGVAHVLGSLALGMIGVSLGWAIGGIESLETIRNQVAAWLLIGFGLAYMLWGLRQAMLNKPHGHLHIHDDGTVHRHAQGEVRSHRHDDELNDGHTGITGWALFTIFIFGPCEPLIPQLMYPAAQQSWSALILVTAVFASVTIVTMLGAITLGYIGLSRLSGGSVVRYAHAVSGLALVVCGFAIVFGL
jgi:threonine/homoserine/homoserine lactone efflux protein